MKKIFLLLLLGTSFRGYCMEDEVAGLEGVTVEPADKVEAFMQYINKNYKPKPTTQYVIRDALKSLSAEQQERLRGEIQTRSRKSDKQALTQLLKQLLEAQTQATELQKQANATGAESLRGQKIQLNWYRRSIVTGAIFTTASLVFNILQATEVI